VKKDKINFEIVDGSKDQKEQDLILHRSIDEAINIYQDGMILINLNWILLKMLKKSCKLNKNVQKKVFCTAKLPSSKIFKKR